jgi:hypothetical protein
MVICCVAFHTHQSDCAVRICRGVLIWPNIMAEVRPCQHNTEGTRGVAPANADATDAGSCDGECGATIAGIPS